MDKKLIGLYHEEQAIVMEMWNLGYEELDPPVQRGWKRYFVLREDVARSEDAKFFQGILDKINTTQYSWKRDFKVKRRQRGKKIYLVREQALEQLLPLCFQKKKFSDNERKYFDLIISNEKIGKNFIWLYRFREPWRFKLKIEPNIIRRTRIKNYDLERRRREIDQYLKINNLRPKMQKIIHGQYQWRSRYNYLSDLPKYKYDPFKNRSFSDILYEYLPERTSRSLTETLKPEGFFFW